jgi:kynureninase
METSSVAEESEAQHLDILHPEPSLRENFEFPVNPKTGEQSVYVCSHGLGLMPKETRQRIQEELDCWSKSAIHAHTPEGHHYKRPWQELAESCCKLIAPLLGAQEDEVVITGALTINLHQLFVSFYRPTHLKNKILIESNSFPSDYYALSSLVSARGYNATDTLVELPCDKDYVVDMDVVVQKIYALKDELTLVWLPGVQFYTG